MPPCAKSRWKFNFEIVAQSLRSSCVHQLVNYANASCASRKHDPALRFLPPWFLSKEVDLRLPPRRRSPCNELFRRETRWGAENVTFLHPDWYRRSRRGKNDHKLSSALSDVHSRKCMPAARWIMQIHWTLTNCISTRRRWRSGLGTSRAFAGRGSTERERERERNQSSRLLNSRTNRVFSKKPMSVALEIGFSIKANWHRFLLNKCQSAFTTQRRKVRSDKCDNSVTYYWMPVKYGVSQPLHGTWIAYSTLHVVLLFGTRSRQH